MKSTQFIGDTIFHIRKIIIAFFLTILCISFSKAQNCSKEITFDMLSKTSYITDKTSLKQMDTLEVLGLSTSETTSNVSICEDQRGAISMSISTPRTKNSRGTTISVNQDAVTISTTEGEIISSANVAELKGEEKEEFEKVFSLKNIFVFAENFSPEYLLRFFTENHFEIENISEGKVKFSQGLSYVYLDYSQKTMTVHQTVEDGSVILSTTKFATINGKTVPTETTTQESFFTAITKTCIKLSNTINFSNYKII